MLVKFVVLGDVRIGFPAAYPRQSKSQSAFQSVSIQGREEAKYTAERGGAGRGERGWETGGDSGPRVGRKDVEVTRVSRSDRRQGGEGMSIDTRNGKWDGGWDE